MSYQFARLSIALPRLTKEKQLLLSFVSALFVSALLLFAIQPMFAKMVLPRLGGAPAVWSVAMCFFQTMLLLGYAYAHILIKWCTPRQAVVIHFAVLALALISLPIAVASGWDIPPEEGIHFWVIGLFGVSIGLPFFALAGNATLLQAWFARSSHSHANDPYFLYGASNLGSLLALLLYPVFFEPFLRVGEQSHLWSVGYMVLIMLVGLSAVLFWNEIKPEEQAGKMRESDSAAGVNLSASEPLETSWALRLRWVLLAMIPSALLVAVTNHITTDIASAPFIWVLPLALFLITFIITFQKQPVLKHHHMLLIQPFFILAVFFTLLFPEAGVWVLFLFIHLGAFFITAMVCHGRLVESRPTASRLTEFYLAMSFGGMLGGVFSSLVAPHIFSTVQEYPLLIMASIFVRPNMDQMAPKQKYGLIAGLVILIAGHTLWGKLPANQMEKQSFRSFFGVNYVHHENKNETTENKRRFRLLSHGTTLHGAQRIDIVQDRPEPLTYYHHGSAFADTFQSIRQVRSLNRVGVVGMGVGSLACYKQPNELWSFYEIDPVVIKIAKDPAKFTFLDTCGSDAEIILGDARLMLGQKKDRRYDLLIIDAFSSDAIPVHLLTVEAVKSYMDKLTENGVLLLHISNRYMNLKPLVSSLAKELNLTGLIHATDVTQELLDEGKTGAIVAALARRPEDLPLRKGEGHWQEMPAPLAYPWTDDYSNVLGLILDKIF